MRDFSQKPRLLPGGFYCSPWCGGTKGFCKKADFDAATRKATRLARSLGPGWKPVVHENLGWHWKVVNGPFEVHDDGGKSKTRFAVWFQGQNLGSGVPQIIESGSTPIAAMKKVRIKMRIVESSVSTAAKIVDKMFSRLSA